MISENGCCVLLINLLITQLVGSDNCEVKQRYCSKTVSHSRKLLIFLAATSQKATKKCILELVIIFKFILFFYDANIRQHNARHILKIMHEENIMSINTI